jgi:MYXO-CTERM domain-containing protein
VTTDARNVPRPQGGACDIGAFELQPSVTPTATATATPTATPTPTPIPGDYNRDGFVDIRDYGVWRANFGQTNCGNPADGDGNCLVDIRDYGIWRQHFGEGTPPDRSAPPALPTGIRPVPRGTPSPALPGSNQVMAGNGAPLQADGSAPAVPLVPLVGGLLGLGGLAGWQRRRPGR